MTGWVGTCWVALLVWGWARPRWVRRRGDLFSVPSSRLLSASFSAASPAEDDGGREGWPSMYSCSSRVSSESCLGLDFAHVVNSKMSMGIVRW
jgi:hypothetical protein